MKIFLWGLKECGASNVPSFALLRRVQEKLRKQVATPTRMFKSVLGNVFWVNDLVHLVGKDFSNPLVRPHLHLYPEDPPEGIVTEVWHCEKWHKDVDWSHLTPMVEVGNRHFYVNEFCLMSDGTIIIPKRWVKRQGELHADAYFCERINVSFSSSHFCIKTQPLAQDKLVVHNSCVQSIPISALIHNFPDLLALHSNLLCDQISHTILMPNPL